MQHQSGTTLYAKHSSPVTLLQFKKYVVLQFQDPLCAHYLEHGCLNQAKKDIYLCTFCVSLFFSVIWVINPKLILFFVLAGRKELDSSTCLAIYKIVAIFIRE
jgi:hypothetical protein